MFLIKFRELLELNYLNDKKFAEKSNIPYSTVRGWTALKRLPDYNAIIKIADYFDISIDELVGREKKGILEIRQNNDISEIIKSYKRLSDKQKRHIRINIYTMLEDTEKLEKEINAS